MDKSVEEKLEVWAEKYNDRRYFERDPISFPRHFLDNGASLMDIEIAAVFSSHLAWGRREMIVRDCERLFDQMEWKPKDYLLGEDWRNDDVSLHRTIKWSETAAICRRLLNFYKEHGSLEEVSVGYIRTDIFGSKEDPKAANKKINMMRRWMVRDDGKVDLGVWKHTDKKTLVIPLDVHVYSQAVGLGLTSRKPKDIVTAMEITDSFRKIFPDDPCLGDFALFGHGIDSSNA